jgi:coatomer protein complex subunit gamma
MSFQFFFSNLLISSSFTPLYSAQALHWKDEDGAEVSPFANIDKSAVIQECKVFHDSNFVKNHPKRCCQHITKLLYILTQGESLGAQDSMQVFFGVTKLFQSTDGNLRKSIILSYST